MLKIFIDIIIIFLFNPHYLRVYIKIPLRSVSSFEVQKWKMVFLEKYSKNETQNRHAFYITTENVFYLKTYQYNI